MITYYNVPKKDARFLKIKDIANLLNDDKKGKIFKNIDYEYFSNHVSSLLDINFVLNVVFEFFQSKPNISEKNIVILFISPVGKRRAYQPKKQIIAKLFLPLAKIARESVESIAKMCCP